MRSNLLVHVGRCFDSTVAGFSRFIGSNAPKSGRVLAFATAALFALCAGNKNSTAASAENATATIAQLNADGTEEFLETHDPPIITNFQVFTDGLDNYEFTGTVTNCDNVNLLEVQFDGAAAGATAITGLFGDFTKILYLPGYSGLEATAVVTCREGLTSDYEFVFLP